MIEKKFKDLVLAFLKGEIGPAEMDWLVGDLRQRRDRRDLFADAVEYYLENEAGPARRVSDQNLRELLVKDLAQVDVRELERAMPRRSTLTSMANVSKPASSEDEKGSMDPAEKVEEILFEKPPPQREDRSFAMPIIGILIILLTFFFMVRFSSIKKDEKEAEELAREKQASELSDAAAFRQADEFLSASHLKESSSSSDEEETTTSSDDSSEAPVSLVDLVGADSDKSDAQTAKAGDEILVFENP
ncbi:MAG: hypothetical protein ACQKBT_03550 [Puniceicoccales bacterium]